MSASEMQNPSEPLAPTEPDLSVLQARLLERRASQTESRAASPSKSGYPGVQDVECVCTKCGKEFAIPMWFNGPDRPVGSPPSLCEEHRRELDELEASRIRSEQEEKRRQDEAAKAKDVLALVEEAGGNPFEFGRFTLNTFPAKPEQEKAILAAIDWKDAILASRDKYEKVRGLYLVGPTGTAKTQIMHCVLRALLEAGMKPGKDVIFDDSMSLVERIQGTYGSDESTWALLEARIAARVWILDDFMAEKPTPDVVRKLTLIFNRREGKPTGVTSNDTPDALRGRWPEEGFRLLSRFGVAQFRLVGVTGEDMRFNPAA